MSKAETNLINAANRELERAASIRPDLIVAEGYADSPLATEIFRTARMSLIVRAGRVERAIAELRGVENERDWRKAMADLDSELESLTEMNREAKRRLKDS